MRLDLLSKHYVNFFANAQPEIKKQEEVIEDIVLKNPFLMTEEIFSDVLPTINSDKFYAISYLGSQGKGKSFSASCFATLAEKEGYLVIYAKAEDILVDMPAWIDSVKRLILQHNDPRVCFVLDDMSYAVGTISSKKAALFKHFVGDIRHVFEPVLGTIKIFMIYISHRFHSLPPMLRNSGSWIFASMQSEDRSDAMKLIPKQKEQRERLESLYMFLSKVSKDGPKFIDLKFNIGESDFSFKWGTEEDPGDGRLMMSYHGGNLKVFNSKKIGDMIKLESYQLVPKPKEEPTEEEMESSLKKQAEILFPKPKDEMPITSLVPMRI